MSHIPEDLEQRIALLSADEKARLALYLLETLEPAEAGDIDAAWCQEAQARLAAVAQGEAQTSSADEVFANLDRRLP